MRTDALLLAALCGACTVTANKMRGLEDAGRCPGSPADMHAKCSIVVLFPSNTCGEVDKEVSARLLSNTWVDPHNGGTYTMQKRTAHGFEAERTTGDGKYTDRFVMTFVDGSATDSGEGASCRLVACSESQVTSRFDASTNYCTLRNLYCNHDDGCAKQYHHLSYEEVYVECWQNDKNKCIVDTSGESDASADAGGASTLPGELPFGDEHDYGEDLCFPEWGKVALCWMTAWMTAGRADVLQCMMTCDASGHDPNTCEGGCGMLDDCHAACFDDDTCKEEAYEALKCYGCNCANGASTLHGTNGEWSNDETTSADASTLPGELPPGAAMKYLRA